jgi:transcriptional regulator with XRE-family HTH domain
MATLAKLLINAIAVHEKAGGSRYRLARASGVSQSQLSKLVRGVRTSLRIETAEQLADAMGYRIVLREKRG